MAKDPRLTKIGATKYNQPKRTPKHKTKSHAVVAKVKNTIKLIRFGQQGVSGAGKNPTSKSEKIVLLFSTMSWVMITLFTLYLRPPLYSTKN